MEYFEQFIGTAIRCVELVAQFFALVVISIGIAKASMIFFKDIFMGAAAANSIEESRLELGHAFSLGLGFLIGSSILKTTLAPSWNDIGQLGAIIAIRTILNLLLQREIQKFVRRTKHKTEYLLKKAISQRRESV
ncbi:MAG: DUF1622 domain-containing protein [Lentisphaerae bacterium]|nr:MAG: DUF1622 domain-containing protein [Lentisphaerota bacterium]